VPLVNEPIRVEHVAGARVVRLDDGANLFDDGFLAAFHEALDAIEAEATGAPMVTTANGKFFSNGFDLEYLGGLHGDTLWDFVTASCALLARIVTFPAPTVAAVNGHAFGIGAILSLAHDRRVMRADRGWFCLPEVDLGLAFHPFMQALITARLPADTAAEAMLTGRRYDGAAAFDAGIVHTTASEHELLDRAVEELAPWAGKQPDVIGRLKAQLYAPLRAALER
jgi:enoyl-CoA hydratase/carnithine racemase